MIALCDVDSRALQKCKEALLKVKDDKVKEYKDLRVMLENKNIDAVLIATPDHWMHQLRYWQLRPGNMCIWKNLVAILRKKGKF